jgi:hypothetical protein
MAHTTPAEENRELSPHSRKFGYNLSIIGLRVRCYRLHVLLVTLFLATCCGFAQQSHEDLPGVLSHFDAARESSPVPDLMLLHPHLPLMSPDVALQAFQRRQGNDYVALSSYTDETLVIAELPESSQRGAFELQRTYMAPHSLTYKPIQFTGDGFVKSNVIIRLLQSEADFVQKGDHQQVALNQTNYKFSYKGLQDLDGQAVYVYQVKPRVKHVGLFKGRVYLDAHTGSVRRSEGSVVKPPSFFIRKLEFVQDYATIDSYTFPVHLHSTAQARIIGRTIVDIYHRDYHLQTAASESAVLGSH